jgi:hypothetical protein
MSSSASNKNSGTTAANDVSAAGAKEKGLTLVSAKSRAENDLRKQDLVAKIVKTSYDHVYSLT